MQIYREALHPNGKVIYIAKHSKHEAPGPLHGKPICAPYGPLEGMQQKRLAARRHKTTYAYDFPTVFGNALREIWTTRAISGEPGSQPKGERCPWNDITISFECAGRALLCARSVRFALQPTWWE